jgi:myo-inositol-1(or 4)-monophosphatase
LAEELLTLAREVGREAAAFVAGRRPSGRVDVSATKSSPTDVVTEIDEASERLIRERIFGARPDDGFVGEEGNDVVGTTGVEWVVDPIDGTVNFLYGIPHWAVSIAVVEGEPDPLTWRGLAGAVFCPPTGELFTGATGHGAFLGEEPLRVAPAVELSQALVATGFAYDSWMRGQQGEVVTRLLPRVRDIRRQGTASLDLCFVAAGRYNAYFERTLNAWDHAAGAIIAREAGAVVKGWGDAAAPSRDFILAAEPAVASTLETALEEVGAVHWQLRG